MFLGIEVVTAVDDGLFDGFVDDLWFLAVSIRSSGLFSVVKIHLSLQIHITYIHNCLCDLACASTRLCSLHPVRYVFSSHLPRLQI